MVGAADSLNLAVAGSSTVTDYSTARRRTVILNLWKEMEHEPRHTHVAPGAPRGSDAFERRGSHPGNRRGLRRPFDPFPPALSAPVLSRRAPSQRHPGGSRSDQRVGTQDL